MNTINDAAAHWTFRDNVAMSLGQWRLWTLQQIDTADPTYNLLAAMRISGRLDPAGLHAAFLACVQRHESLRTRFRPRAGVPSARVEPTAAFTIQRYDLTLLQDVKLRDATIQRLAWNTARSPFDLENGPLFRLALIVNGPAEHVLLLGIHHMIADGWSLGLLIAEIASSYTAYLGNARLTFDPPSYGIADYIRESRVAIDSAPHRESVAYWRERLTHVRWTTLSPDFDAPSRRRIEGRTRRFSFGDILGVVEIAARSCNLTCYQFMLSTFMAFIGRLTGAMDVAIATLFGNRRTRQHQHLIGFLANTVIVRCSVEATHSTRQFLERCSEEIKASILHGSVSLYTLAQENPEFLATGPRILFSLQNNPLPALKLGELDFEMIDVDSGISKFDLSFYVAELNGRMDIWVEYDVDLFHDVSIERMVHAYSRYLLDLSDLSQMDRPLLHRACPGARLTSSKQTELTVMNESVVTPLLRQIIDRPHSMAYVIDHQPRSYGELWAGIQAASAQLSALGCAIGDAVLLLGDRSFGQLCSIWACLCNGIVFVPLSGQPPEGKLEAIIRNVRPVAILVDDQNWLEWSPLAVLYAPRATDPREQGNALQRVLDEQRTFPPELPAYIIYTSGSTGHPKGVTVSRRSLSVLFDALDEKLPVSDRSVWLAVSSLSFDIASVEVLWAPSRGVKSVVFDVRRLYESTSVSNGPTYPRASRAAAVSLCYFPDMNQYSAEEHDEFLLKSALWADANEFFALWTPERHFGRFGTAFTNPGLTSAYLANATRSVNIRAGSVVGPLHHTARLAEDWAALSRLSGGRVGISLAAGWNPQDFVLATGPLHRKHDLIKQQIDEIRRLWRGEQVAFPDAQGRFFGTSLALPPLSTIPLSVTISNRPEQFRFAAVQQLDVFTHLLEQSIDQLANNIAEYRQAWRDHHGADAQPGRVTVMLHTYVADTDEKASREALRPLMAYLGASVKALAPLLQEGVAQGRLEREFESEDSPILARFARELIESRSLICGAATALRRLHRLSFAGVDEVACLIDFGIPPREILDALPALAEARLAARQPTRASDDSPASDVTHLQCTPSLAKILLDQPAMHGVLQGLSHWLLGGEELSSTLARQIERVTEAQLINMYGPTEATVWASMASISRGTKRISLGSALPGAQLSILDARLQELPMGVAGHLYIGGAGVAQGYWGRPALTAQCFVPDPSGPPGSRRYASGDSARVAFDGELLFLGRTDSQVKIKGNRLELSAVARMLEDCAVIANAVVAAYPASSSDADDLEIIGFVVLNPGACGETWRKAVNRHLAQHLETPLMPRELVPLRAIPLTVNHKTDHRQLAALYAAYRRSQQDTLSAVVDLDRKDESVERVRSAWDKFVSKAGDDQSSFFSVGGNSLLAMRLIAHCNDRFQVNVTLRDFYREPTLRGLALLVASESSKVDRAALGRVPRDRPRYPASYQQRAMLFLAQLQMDNRAYHDAVIVELQGEVSIAALREAFEAILHRHSIFRTAYHLEDDRFFQIPLPFAHSSVVFETETLLPTESSADDHLALSLHSFIDAPFDLMKGEVVRAKVLNKAADRAYLCLAFHHIVNDGWSLRLVLAEFLENYARAVRRLPLERTEAEWQYIDFSAWQIANLDVERRALLAFWLDYCKDISPTFLPVHPGSVLPGVGDRQRISTGFRVSFECDDLLALSLEELAGEHRVTLFALLASALFLVLEAHCEQADVCIATDAANRTLPEFERIPGIMVNQILLRVIVPDEIETWTFVAHTHARVAAAFSHQQLPYDVMVSELNPVRRGANSALFDVKLVLNEVESSSLSSPKLVIRELDVEARAAKFGVLFNLHHRAGNLSGYLDFDDARFDRTFIERLCREFLLVLRALRHEGSLSAIKKQLRPAPDSHLSTIPRRLAEARRRAIHNPK